MKLHRDVGSTLCPGKHIDLVQIKNWLDEYSRNPSLSLASQHESVLSLAGAQAQKTATGLLLGLAPLLLAAMVLYPLAVFRGILRLSRRIFGGAPGFASRIGGGAPAAVAEEPTS